MLKTYYKWVYRLDEDHWRPPYEGTVDNLFKISEWAPKVHGPLISRYHGYHICTEDKVVHWIAGDCYSLPDQMELWSVKVRKVKGRGKDSRVVRTLKLDEKIGVWSLEVQDEFLERMCLRYFAWIPSNRHVHPAFHETFRYVDMYFAIDSSQFSRQFIQFISNKERNR